MNVKDVSCNFSSDHVSSECKLWSSFLVRNVSSVGVYITQPLAHNMTHLQQSDLKQFLQSFISEIILRLDRLFSPIFFLAISTLPGSGPVKDQCSSVAVIKIYTL